MNYIFITGMGRSGTVLMSKLLQGIDNTVVKHEHIGNREYWLLSWYLSPDNYSKQYLENERNKIEKSYKQEGFFIDVNGYLQNSATEIYNIFPNSKIFHLVRDGRDVVRSLYSRRNEKDTHLIPKDKESIKKWLTYNKFEKICWNWNNTTQKLISLQIPILRLEDVISDYTYLKKNFIETTGLEISKSYN